MCKSIRSSHAKCTKCQIFGTFGTPNTKNPPDAPNLIIFLFHFLSHLSVSLTLKPQSSPLKPHFVSLSPIPCFSWRCCLARPRRLRAHQDADVRRRVLRLRRSDPVAHRARFLLRLRVHQDRARESNHLPTRRWRESDFQHNQADDRVDRLGQGGDRAWVGVLDCWGDL